MDSWEALDIDDSDLSSSSFLRPCKRRLSCLRPSSPKGTSAAAVSQSSSPQPYSQTLDLPPSPPSAACPDPVPASLSRIPGPAGDVQAAMHRKALNHRTGVLDHDPVPTQEYIRRVVENGAGDEDEDFSQNPWLSTVEFLLREGMVNGGAIGTPICGIKKRPNPDRVPQVVAVIKSCSPDSLGDLMITLKDPTGSIGASVHHKVLAGESGKDLCVGSVLILQKVAVFSPSRSAHYLNVMLDNVVKVFSKNSPPLEQNYSASTGKNAALECYGQTWIPHKELSLSRGRTEGVRESASQVANRNQMQNNAVAGGISCSYRSSGDTKNQCAGTDMEFLMARLDSARRTTKEPFNINLAEINGQMHVDGNDKQPERTEQPGGIYPNNSATNLGAATNDREVVNENGAKYQTHPFSSNGRIPEWTDEQLDALSALDENDISVF